MYKARERHTATSKQHLRENIPRNTLLWYTPCGPQGCQSRAGVIYYFWGAFLGHGNDAKKLNRGGVHSTGTCACTGQARRTRAQVATAQQITGTEAGRFGPDTRAPPRLRNIQKGPLGVSEPLQQLRRTNLWVHRFQATPRYSRPGRGGCATYIAWEIKCCLPQGP